MMDGYHTLLPRYLQDALRRAAQQHEAGSFVRQCAIEHAVVKVKCEYPLGFRHDLQKLQGVQDWGVASEGETDECGC